VPIRQQAAIERAPAGVTVKTTSPMAHLEHESGPRSQARMALDLDAFHGSRHDREGNA